MDQKLEDREINNTRRYLELEEPFLEHWGEILPRGIYEELYTEMGIRMGTKFYATMLKYLAVGDYIRSLQADRGGKVLSIIRDSDDIPLCVQIKTDSYTRRQYEVETDYVLVYHIAYWDKWKEYRGKSRKKYFDEKIFFPFELETYLMGLEDEDENHPGLFYDDDATEQPVDFASTDSVTDGDEDDAAGTFLDSDGKDGVDL